MIRELRAIRLWHCTDLATSKWQFEVILKRDNAQPLRTTVANGVRFGQDPTVNVEYSSKERKCNARSAVRALAIISIMMLVVSVPNLMLFAIEIIADHNLYSTYQISPSYGSEISKTFANRSVVVSHANAHAGDVNFPYQIRIDGADWTMPLSVPSGVKLVAAQRDNITVGILGERDTGREHLAITQLLSTSDQDLYRILLIDKEGEVTEDVFASADRRTPGYRLMLMRWTGRVLIGHYTNVANAWPSIVYPIAYPIGSASAGLIIGIIAIRKRLRGC